MPQYTRSIDELRRIKDDKFFDLVGNVLLPELTRNTLEFCKLLKQRLQEVGNKKEYYDKCPKWFTEHNELAYLLEGKLVIPMSGSREPILWENILKAKDKKQGNCNIM